MKDFPIIETAFSGYRLLLAKPVTAAIWFVFSLTVTAAAMAAAVTLAGPELMAMRQMQQSGQVDPASMMAITQRMGPYYAFSYIFPWLTGAITLGAATRAVLKPQASSLGYLRFGGDEFRLLMTTLVIGVILVLAFIVTALIGGIAFGVSAGTAGLQAMRNGGPLPASAVAITGLAALPGIALLIFLAVEFSLAPAETVGKSGVRIFGSFGFIKGRFWKCLAIYALAAVPAVLIGGLSAYATLAATGAHGNLREMSQAMQADMGSMSAAFSGPHWIGFILSAVGRTIAMAAFIVPAAIIYQSVAPKDLDEDDDDYDDDDDEVNE